MIIHTDIPKWKSPVVLAWQQSNAPVNDPAAAAPPTLLLLLHYHGLLLC